MVTIKINDKTFDVYADGTVHQSQCASGVELDEARLQAAPTFLFEARKRGLSKQQHAFWVGMSMTTDVRNLANSQKGHRQ